MQNVNFHCGAQVTLKSFTKFLENLLILILMANLLKEFGIILLCSKWVNTYFLGGPQDGVTDCKHWILDVGSD